MIMQARAMRDCSHIAECSLSYAMTVQGECSSKSVICNDNANEGNESLLSYCRVQPVICKDNIKYFILLLP